MRRALLVSLLGVAAVSGCGSGHAFHPKGTVPWVDRPLPLYHTPQPQPIRYPSTAPLCRAGQLRVSQGRGGPATGHELEEFLFTNGGSRTCLLRGYPAISAETPAGARRTLHPGHGTFFTPLIAADVSPGRHVLFDIETDDLCVGGTAPVLRYRRLLFVLPWGGSVAGGKLSITKQCGLAISAFGLPENYVEPRSRAGTPGTLQALVHLPARIRPGTKELDYVVTLSNPTARTVRLRPCPGYTDEAYVRGVVVHRSFALDCDSVHAIVPHGHVEYAMVMKLPRPLPAGPTTMKFGWSLDTPNGPFVGRALLITKH